MKDCKKGKEVICDDNESLVNKGNEPILYGNHGLHADVSMIIEMRKTRKKHPNITFQ